MKLSKKVKVAVSLLVLAILCSFSVALLLPFAPKAQASYIYIDTDDTTDSVMLKLDTVGTGRGKMAYTCLSSLLGYGNHVREGRYDVGSGQSALAVVRRLRNGQQSPLNLTIPPVRTLEALASRLSKVLAADSASLASTFHDAQACQAVGCDTATLPAIFLANTYEVFWNISPQQLLSRMKKESDNFWTSERRAQAAAAGLTPTEVVTLASIVDQETAYEPEKPQVAGMYLNRLHSGMKLQADPTVKFALRDFSLRRILHTHLVVDSPYNTYKYEGLPPGPIAIPSRSSIEAVLNYAHHDYLYMCAKEDFSGSHRFTKTYEEHLVNARRYAQALNERGIN